ncbi:MAG: hypothetical protein ACREAA_04845 [Candidatus Polarisedimenticolia bacterium]
MNLSAACYGQLTPEQWEKVTSWMAKDMCFALGALSLAMNDLGFELPEDDRAVLQRHEEECAGCWENILTRSQGEDDSFRRRIYLNVYHFGLWALLRQRGGKFEMEEVPTGTRFYTQYPPDMDLPYTAADLRIPRDPSQACELILDVRTAEIYKEPREVLHSMDRTLATEIKVFNRPGGEAIQWWPIVDDRPCELKVRWEGQTRHVATDWRLQPRYSSKLRDWQAPLNDPDENESTGLAALRLRNIALEYDGSSRFAGFLATTLPWRLADEYQRRSRDVAESVVRVPRFTDEASDDLPLKEEHEARKQESVEQAARSAWVMDRPKITKQLLEQLTKQERLILDLKMKGLSDEEAGKEVGLTRETVNRKMKIIRQKGASIYR